MAAWRNELTRRCRFPAPHVACMQHAASRAYLACAKTVCSSCRGFELSLTRSSKRSHAPGFGCPLPSFPMHFLMSEASHAFIAMGNFIDFMAEVPLNLELDAIWPHFTVFRDTARLSLALKVPKKWPGHVG